MSVTQTCAVVDDDAPAVLKDRQQAEGFTASVCFKHGPPRLLGVELEWIFIDRDDPARPVPGEELRRALGELAPVSLLDPPGTLSVTPLLADGGSVSCEPGGQLELSSAPAASLPKLLAAVRRESATLHQRLHHAGLAPSPWALDPLRHPQRVLRSPRYEAMSEYFARFGADGGVMMGSCAAVHVNVDAGVQGTSGSSAVRRWRLLHRAGPVLLATFANSPLMAGRRTGMASTRMAVWQQMDPARTSPVAPEAETDDELARGYARAALEAPLICLRRPGADWRPPPGITFGDWVDGALATRPTEDDLAYHLTTLFPPVRAHGHLEARYLDAQRGDAWDVPLAVLAGLLASEDAVDAALDLLEPAAGRWTQAAQAGLADPVLAAAAPPLLELAAEHAPIAADPALAARYAFAIDRAAAGRCPGDDRLDTLAHDDTLARNDTLAGSGRPTPDEGNPE